MKNLNEQLINENIDKINLEGGHKENMDAIINIGKEFGLTEEDFEKDKLTRENLFNPNKVIVIG